MSFWKLESGFVVCVLVDRGVYVVRFEVFMRWFEIKKYVSRVYGGFMCVKCVRDSIECVFFIEE